MSTCYLLFVLMRVNKSPSTDLAYGGCLRNGSSRDCYWGNSWHVRRAPLRAGGQHRACTQAALGPRG